MHTVLITMIRLWGVIRLRALVPRLPSVLETNQPKNYLSSLKVRLRSDRQFSTETKSCWKCQRPLNSSLSVIFCPGCETIVPPPETVDYFRLFGVDPTFSQDTANLSKTCRDLQRLVHPDKFSLRSDREHEISEQWSPIINTVHSVLSRPLPRALHLLEVLGRPLLEEDVDMEPGFLLSMMELNEEVAEIGEDVEDVKKVGREVRGKFEQYVEMVGKAFGDGDVEKARTLVTEMKYYDNILQKLFKLESDLGITE